jgi:hypothetical protein
MLQEPKSRPEAGATEIALGPFQQRQALFEIACVDGGAPCRDGPGDVPRPERRDDPLGHGADDCRERGCNGAPIAPHGEVERDEPPARRRQKAP